MKPTVAAPNRRGRGFEAQRRGVARRVMTASAVGASLVAPPALARAAPGCKTGTAAYERAQFGMDVGLSAGAIGVSALGVYGVTQVRGDQWVPAIDSNVPVEHSRGPKIASDVLTFGSYAVAAGVAVYTTVRCRNEYTLKRSRATPLLEVFWPWMWTVGVTELTKSFSGRPRPYTRGHEGFSEDPDDYRSFFSGHTSTSTVMVTATVAASLRFSPTLSRPLPRTLISVGSGLAYGMTAGSMRVLAAEHHWSDVLIGASVGTAIGLLPSATELFGARDRDGRPSVRVGPWMHGTGATVLGRF